MTEWKFGDVLRLTDKWIKEQNAQNYRDLRVMFIAHRKGRPFTILGTDLTMRRHDEVLEKEAEAFQLADD